jgi:hypothetical protein
MPMGWKRVVPITAALLCNFLVAASNAQEKSTNEASAVSAKDLTREQFQALAPDAVIEINGERITKGAFQARNVKAAEEAVKQLQDIRARALAAFEARRKALLDQRAAALAESNKKVEPRSPSSSMPMRLSTDPIGKRARNRRPICSKKPRKQRRLSVPSC